MSAGPSARRNQEWISGEDIRVPPFQRNDFIQGAGKRHKPVPREDFPGEKMTDISNNFFSYSIPEKLKDCNNLYVTFNDGKGNSINQWLTMHWDYKSGKIDYIPQDIRTAYNAVGYYYNYPYLDYDDLKTLKWRCYWSTSYTGIIGDFNNDGKISSKDALGILRSSIGYDVDGWYLLGNVNDDDKLTAADSLEVLRYTINAHCSENIGKALLQ